MAEGSASRLSCPACDRKYRFKPELAGRKAKCKCGATLRMPKDENSPIQIVEGSSPKPAPPPKAAGDIKIAGDDDSLSIPMEPEPTTSKLSSPKKNDGFVDLDSMDIGLSDGEAEPAPTSKDAGSSSTNPLNAAFNNSPGNVDSYDLDIDLEPAGDAAPPPSLPAAGAGKGNCPSCGQSVKPGAVICMNCGFNIKEGKKITTQVGDGPATPAKPTTPGAIPAMGMNSTAPARPVVDDSPNYMLKEVYGPLAILAGAIFLILLDIFVLAGMAWDTHETYILPYSILGNIIIKGLQIIVTVPSVIAGVVCIAMLFGSELGTIHTFILKLAAMVLMLVGFGAVIDSLGDIVTGGFGGIAGYMTFAFNFGVFWGLCAWLLDAENVEILILYVFVYILPTIIIIFAGAAIMNMLGY